MKTTALVKPADGERMGAKAATERMPAAEAAASAITAAERMPATEAPATEAAAAMAAAAKATATMAATAATPTPREHGGGNSERNDQSDSCKRGGDRLPS
jgi:hypothetical protein